MTGANFFSQFVHPWASRPLEEPGTDISSEGSWDSCERVVKFGGWVCFLFCFGVGYFSLIFLLINIQRLLDTLKNKFRKDTEKLHSNSHVEVNNIHFIGLIIHR